MRTLVLVFLVACVPQQPAPNPGGAPQTSTRPIDTPKPNTPDPPAVEEPKPNVTRNESGTRLKVNYLDGQDGSRAFLGFYDSTRKEDCSFQLAEDGKTRCFPAGLTLVKGNGYYEDSACTKQLAYLTTAPCGVKPAYAAMWDYAACPSYSVAVFELGAQVTATNVYVVANGCVAIARPANMTFYKLGARVPDAEFASAAKKTE